MSRMDQRDASMYLSLASRSPVLGREEELELARQYRDSGDAVAAEKLTRSMLRYVISVAVKYRSDGLSLSDLIAEGNVGVLHALGKFDPERGVRFVTFASHWIRASILGFALRSRSLVQSGAPRPRVLFRLRKDLDRLQGELRDVDAAKDQLALEMGIERSDLDCMLARLGRSDVSLNAPMPGEDRSMLDELLDPDVDIEEEVSSRMQRDVLPGAVRGAMQQLDARERLIAEKRFMADPEEQLTLAELGTMLKVSRERVRQLEVRARTKLRQYLAAAFPTPDGAAAQAA